MRDYLRQVETAQLVAELGEGASALAQAVPDLRSFLADLPPLPPTDPEQARFQLFAAFKSWLANAAQRQPVVLVLDDL